jgi:hypothetical protein
MKFNSVLIFVLLLFIESCSTFVIRQHLVGEYYLTAPDEDSQLALSFQDPANQNGYIGIVPATVLAIGYNAKYIIVKRRSQDESNKVKADMYYIVLIQNKMARLDNKNFIGPLTYNQFISERKELNIPDSLHFTKQYPNLK